MDCDDEEVDANGDDLLLVPPSEEVEKNMVVVGNDDVVCVGGRLVRAPKDITGRFSLLLTTLRVVL